MNSKNTNTAFISANTVGTYNFSNVFVLAPNVTATLANWAAMFAGTNFDTMNAKFDMNAAI
jgi:hypothetical protein